MQSLVTYELVVEAANRLETSEQKVTVANLRSALGNIGSNQTIHKFYKLWQQEKFLQGLAPENLPLRLKNILTNKLKNKVDDQTYFLEQAKKRISELENKAKSLAGQNTKLQNQKILLETELKKSEDGLYRKNLQVEQLEKILSEVKFQHQSHIKFLESSLEKVSKAQKESFEYFREQNNSQHEKHQREVLGYQNQLEKLKQEQGQGASEKAMVFDNLVRHVGELKRELATKNTEIARISKNFN